VTAARERLAQHLGSAPASLSIQAALAQTWPNTALGCPAPDQSYQAISVPGYQLTFGNGTQTFDVHTTLLAAPGEPMVLCENQLPVELAAAPSAATPEAAAAAMIELARQDLAKALGVDISAVTVVSSSPVQWNDSSLGCPKPGQNYLQVVTPGYLVRLSAQGQTYEYHTDARSTVVRCVP
jgi:hypothetical protein